MSRCLYSSGIKRFLSLDDNLIFGTLCDKYHGDAPTTTREAWKGETKEHALIRECQEEFAVALSVGDVYMDVVHEYPDITVHLTLFNATIAEGAPQKLEHNDIRWITPAEITDYIFCPADEEILEAIKHHY